MEAAMVVLLPLALLLIGGHYVTFPSADAIGCGETRKLAFTKVLPAATIHARPGIANNGLQELFVGLHRVFGSMLFSSDVPEALKKADTLDAKLVSELLLGGAGAFWLLVACFLLAVVVPVVGLFVLCVRCLRRPKYEEPETEEQAASRTTSSFRFWAFIVVLTFMAIGALVTRSHASVAWGGLQEQLGYIVHTMPGVLRKPITDIGIIVGPNFKTFSAALNERMKSLTLIGELADKIENASNSDDVVKVRNNFFKATDSVYDAATACTTPCPAATKSSLESKNSEFEQFSIGNPVTLPSSLKGMVSELKKPRQAAALKEVPTSKRLKETLDNNTKELHEKLKEFSDRFSKSIGKLDDSVKRMVKRAQEAAASLKSPPVEVKTGMAAYQAVISVVAAVIAIIVGLYIFGNQCIMWRASSGFCSFNTASWAMTLAVFVFLISFPIFMVASSFGTIVGLGVDRRVCTPAMHLGAPTSRPFIEFLAEKLGTKEARQRSAASPEDDAEMTRGVAGRRRHVRIASAESRHLVATSGSTTRQRKRATVDSPRRQRHRHHAKRRASARGSTLKTAQRLESRHHRNAVRLAKARRGKTARDDNEGGTGGSKPRTDIASALSEAITPKALEGVAERFAKCSHTRLSYFKLLGKDLVTSMARTVLGRKGPMLGLLDDEAGDPKFDALEKMGSGSATLGKVVTFMFTEFANSPINVNEITDISGQAKGGKSDFVKLETLKADLQRLLSSAGPDVIDKAAQNLTKVVMVNGKTLDKYIEEHMDKLKTLQPALESSVKKVLKVDGFKSDVTQFFSHTKEQAAYWCSVWWFLLLGIPSVVAALALSTHFARAVIQKEVSKGATPAGGTTKW
ncbi:hypothetical protein HPB50_024318 [Hyalomma asiaticum]|uniref:Uncharacterized protein n=1 Tax=Hyalomma asiaticum TaxID=266040 RepID=A0ACB7T9M6_HYAAI|nr:hypothetical protein HPB50_024318 [Hyalomma asiaticum]